MSTHLCGICEGHPVSTNLDDGVVWQAGRVTFVHERRPGRCAATCMFVLLGQAAVVGCPRSKDDLAGS